MQDTPSVFSPLPCELGESPLWDERNNCLHWVDIDRGILYHQHADQDSPTATIFPVKISCVALCESPYLLLAKAWGISILRLSDHSEVSYLPVLPTDGPLMFNDGKVDPQGRFWLGTKGPPQQSLLYCFDAKKGLQKVRDGMTISNGIDWSPDQSTIYLTESAEGRIYRASYSPNTTEINDLQVFFQTEDGGCPDGLTVDRDGNVWTAIWDGACVLCLSPRGEVLQKISLPAQRPTSVMFGGTKLDKLFITSAFTGLVASNGNTNSQNGLLFSVNTPAIGRKQNRFHI